MEPSSNALEYLFDCLYHNKPEKVHSILEKAKSQYRDLQTGLTIVEKRKVTFIKSLLNYSEQEKWSQAKNQLAPAEEEYRRYFLNKLRTIPKEGFYRMHGEEMKRTPVSSASSGTKKAVRIETPGSTPGSKRSSATKGEQRDVALRKTPTPLGSKRGTPTLMKQVLTIHNTDTTKRETTADIAAMFESIYENEWLAAAEELKDLKINEKTYSSFLLSIVFEAFKVALIEAENQIGKLQNVAFSLLSGDTPHVTGKAVGDLKHLKRYRKSVAEISVPHLIETFKKRYLPEVARGIGIYQHIRVHGAIDRYTDTVVTACWWMATQELPVHICDDRSQLTTFNESAYRYYSRTGISVDFYVWPALRVSDKGSLLAKGVAEPKQITSQDPTLS